MTRCISHPLGISNKILEMAMLRLPTEGCSFSSGYYPFNHPYIPLWSLDLHSFKPNLRHSLKPWSASLKPAMCFECQHVSVFNARLSTQWQHAGRQTGHSAEGEEQLEIASSTITPSTTSVLLLHCNPMQISLWDAQLSVPPVKCLWRCWPALNAMSSVVAEWQKLHKPANRVWRIFLVSMGASIVQP